MEATNGRPPVDRRIVKVANVLLVGAAVAVAGALVLTLVDHEGRTDSLWELVLYYVAPALLLAGLVLALRSPPERRVNVALLLVSVGFPLYAVEAVLDYRAAHDPAAETRALVDSLCPGRWRLRAGCVAAARAGQPFDSRTVLDVVDDLRAQGVAAVPNLDASLLDDSSALDLPDRQVLPVAAGEARVRTVFCNEVGVWLLYDADEVGFHNQLGVHRPDSVSVAVLGDSFAHGWCVPREATVASVLAVRFPGTVNLGVEGTGPLHQLAVLREYAAPLRPRFVVWLFYEGNDLRDLERERRHPILMRYTSPGYSQGLGASQDELEGRVSPWILAVNEAERARVEAGRPRRPGWAERLTGHPLVGWATLRSLRSAAWSVVEGARGAPESVRQPFARELFREIMARARDDTAAWGGTLVFGYLPSVDRWTRPDRVHPHGPEILATVRELEIPTVDLGAVFEAHPDPLSLFPFRSEVHYTPEGYRLVAEAIAEALGE